MLLWNSSLTGKSRVYYYSSNNDLMPNDNDISSSAYRLSVVPTDSVIISLERSRQHTSKNPLFYAAGCRANAGTHPALRIDNFALPLFYPLFSEELITHHTNRHLVLHTSSSLCLLDTCRPTSHHATEAPDHDRWYLAVI